MPTTKYYYKYHVTINRNDFQLDKKYRSVKEILSDLKDSKYPLSGRNSVYQIMKGLNKWKYTDMQIVKIREPLKVKKRMVVSIIDERYSSIPTISESEKR